MPEEKKPVAPAIPMTQVKSNQVACIGYDTASKTLAVQFTRGTGAVYHYPNVEPKVHADFMAAESIGKFFGQHIKPLPFVKLEAPKPDTSREDATVAPAPDTGRVPWPFPASTPHHPV